MRHGSYRNSPPRSAEGRRQDDKTLDQLRTVWLRFEDDGREVDVPAAACSISFLEFGAICGACSSPSSRRMHVANHSNKYFMPEKE